MSQMRRLALIGIAVLGLGSIASAAGAAVSVGTTPMPTWQTNGRIEAMATVSGVTYAGGTFTRVTDHSGNSITVSNLAAFDAAGNAIPAFHPAVQGEIKALVANHSMVIVGGDFTSVAGTTRNRIAAFSRKGALLPLTANTNGEVSALAMGGGRLYAGGTFTRANGVLRSNAAAFNLTTGVLSRWTANADGRVTSILAQSRRVFLGGYFNFVNGQRARHLAPVSPVYGAVLPWLGHPTGQVLTLGQGTTSTDVFAGVAGMGGAVNDYTATGNRRWVRMVDGNVKTIILVGNQVYIGGHFSNTCTQTGPKCPGLIRRQHLISLYTANGGLTPWNPEANSILGVYAFSRAAGWLSVGGDFTVLGGAKQSHYGRFPIG